MRLYVARSLFLRPSLYSLPFILILLLLPDSLTDVFSLGQLFRLGRGDDKGSEASLDNTGIPPPPSSVGFSMLQDEPEIDENDFDQQNMHDENEDEPIASATNVNCATDSQDIMTVRTLCESESITVGRVFESLSEARKHCIPFCHVPTSTEEHSEIEIRFVPLLPQWISCKTEFGRCGRVSTIEEIAQMRLPVFDSIASSRER